MWSQFICKDITLFQGENSGRRTIPNQTTYNDCGGIDCSSTQGFLNIRFRMVLPLFTKGFFRLNYDALMPGQLVIYLRLK